MLDYFTVYLDSKLFKMQRGLTVMQACSKATLEIPKFCYHERLSIAGNCRMCLVEVSNSKKLIISCAVPLTDNLKIYTNTFRVKRARQGILEFLLVNHPLDCPICDQGGECDLQDITLTFGGDRGRFYEVGKRAIFDKNFGPLVKTIMNRCIHCTRCIRFISEVSGMPFLGTVGRGSSMEISTYIEGFLGDELSGNIIDLCPVGALTSKPFSFTARPWELSNVESIDIMDALNSNIRIDLSLNKVRRILPRLNEELNEEWISNRARFSYDAVNSFRLDSCLLRITDNTSLENGYFFELPLNNSNISSYLKFLNITWSDAFYILSVKLEEETLSHIEGVSGSLSDLESIFVLKEMFTSMGCSNMLGDFDLYYINIDFIFSFVLNLRLKLLEKELSFCILIGMNPRLDSPILNLKLRRAYSMYGTRVYSIGTGLSYSTFPIFNLFNSVRGFFTIVESKHIICKELYTFNMNVLPLILLGINVFKSREGSYLINALLFFLKRLFYFSTALSSFYKTIPLNTTYFNYFGVVHNYSGRINSFEIGFIPGVHSTFISCSPRKKFFLKSFFYFLGFDSVTPGYFLSSKVSWVVYQGHHGSVGAFFANLILPTVSYFEKDVSYFNLLGILQSTRLAMVPPYSVKNDWEVIKAFFEYRRLQELTNFSKISSFFLNYRYYAFVSYQNLVYTSLDALHYRLSTIIPVGALTSNNFKWLGVEGFVTFVVLYLSYRELFFFCSEKLKYSLVGLFLIDSFFFRQDFIRFGKFTSGLLLPASLNYYASGGSGNSILSYSAIMNVCSLNNSMKNYSFEEHLF